MSEELDAIKLALLQQLAAPKEVTTDAGSVENRDIDEIVEAYGLVEKLEKGRKGIQRIGITRAYTE